MFALDRLAPAQSIRAMNSINKLVFISVFMTALIGTAVACGVLGVWAVVSWGERGAVLVLAGSALYVVGAIVVTRAVNVPLNDTLMSVDPDGAGAAGHWSSYLADWIVWNHARAVTTLAASGLLIAALRVSP
jgi:uncharacterized membrane protein